MQWNRRSIFKLFTGFLVWGGFLLILCPFYREILLAAIFGFAISPVLRRVLKRLPIKHQMSVALFLLTSFIVLVVPVGVVFYKAYATVVQVSSSGWRESPVIERLVMLYTSLSEKANEWLSELGLAEGFDFGGVSEDALMRAVNIGLQTVTSVASQIPQLALSLFVFIVALYYFLAESSVLKRAFERQGVLSAKESTALIRLLQECCYNTVVSSVVIAGLQATIVTMGAVIMRTGDVTVVWVGTFVLSFVPMIGAGPVALLLALYQLALGSYGYAIAFVVVAVVAGTVDNLVRPYLIASGGSSLHPIVSLLAIIGALLIFGMAGLFIGPVIAQVAMQIVPVLTEGAKDPARTET